MNISLVIFNHDNNEEVKQCLSDIASKQIIQPHDIYVVSDSKPFRKTKKQKNVFTINGNNNIENEKALLKEFLYSEADALVFLDSNSIPENNNYFENYIKLLNEYDLVYGLEKNILNNTIKKIPFEVMSSMDKKSSKIVEDYREKEYLVELFQHAESNDERTDLIMSGLFSLNNFAMTRNGIEKMMIFMKDNFDIEENIFDSKSDYYKERAFALDAIFAGLKIWISKDVYVKKICKERTDNISSSFIKLHYILERFRKLTKQEKEKDNYLLLMMITFGFFVFGVILGLITGYTML